MGKYVEQYGLENLSSQPHICEFNGILNKSFSLSGSQISHFWSDNNTSCILSFRDTTNEGQEMGMLYKR